ncbi:hypothetical protein IIE18_11950 [Pseudomonas sp. V1]|nr:hypothetical protein [Pseudomonas arcuscaelestis]
MEICEHKGVGHPDTIADAVCEAASRALSRAYLEATGSIQHHNLDKGLLVAGKSRPRFGGGDWQCPIRLIICGRAGGVVTRRDRSCGSRSRSCAQPAGATYPV